MVWLFIHKVIALKSIVYISWTPHFQGPEQNVAYNYETKNNSSIITTKHSVLPSARHFGHI